MAAGSTVVSRCSVPWLVSSGCSGIWQPYRTWVAIHSGHPWTDTVTATIKLDVTASGFG